MYICVHTFTCQQIAAININILKYTVTLKVELSQLLWGIVDFLKKSEG